MWLSKLHACYLEDNFSIVNAEHIISENWGGQITEKENTGYRHQGRWKEAHLTNYLTVRKESTGELVLGWEQASGTSACSLWCLPKSALSSRCAVPLWESCDCGVSSLSSLVYFAEWKVLFKERVILWTTLTTVSTVNIGWRQQIFVLKKRTGAFDCANRGSKRIIHPWRMEYHRCHHLLFLSNNFFQSIFSDYVWGISHFLIGTAGSACILWRSIRIPDWGNTWVQGIHNFSSRIRC